MGVGHGLSGSGKNIGWGSLGIRCWGKCLLLNREEVKRKVRKTAFWRALRPILVTKYFGWSNHEKRDGWSMWHIPKIEGMRTKMREIDNREGTDVDGIIMLKFIFKRWNVGPCTVLILLRTCAELGLLWMRKWTSVFCKMRGICLAEHPLVSQGGLFSLKLVT
jgi:hypothetical protein